MGRNIKSYFSLEMFQWLEGVGSSIFEVALSGFVSVYLERLFKNQDSFGLSAREVEELKQLDIWDRNFQL